MTRARRADFDFGFDEPEMESAHRPLYARMLRLRYLTPSGFLCFVFLEGAVALGILLALAELVSWWGVLVLPAVVALMVKLNDLFAGLLTEASAPVPQPVAARGPVVRPPDPVRVGLVGEASTTRLPPVVDAGQGPIKRPWAERVERVEAQQQWIRQSATRRYE